MDLQLRVAVRCIREMDALAAAVRFNDAAAAALLRPAEQRRPDFDEWLTGRRRELEAYVLGWSGAPADLADLARYVRFLLKSHSADARGFRRTIWFLRRVLRVRLPLAAPPESAGQNHDPAAGSAVSWVFLLAIVALWFAATR